MTLSLTIRTQPLPAPTRPDHNSMGGGVKTEGWGRIGMDGLVQHDGTLLF